MGDAKNIVGAYRLGFRTGFHQGSNKHCDPGLEYSVLASVGILVTDETREAFREGVNDGIRGFPLIEPATEPPE